jgi:hypothetical protein
MHSRDEGFKNQAHHKARPDPLYDKAHPKKPARCCRSAHFTNDAVAVSDRTAAEVDALSAE